MDGADLYQQRERLSPQLDVEHKLREHLCWHILQGRQEVLRRLMDAAMDWDSGAEQVGSAGQR